MLGARSVGCFFAVVVVTAACGSGKGDTGGPAASSTGGQGAAGGGGSGTGSATGGSGSGTGGSGAGTTTSTTGTGGAKSCAVFLPSSPWNTDVSGVASDQAATNTYVASIGAGKNLHPDFGTDPTAGIPYQDVNDSIGKSPVTFDPQAADESDPGPYPIPPNPLIEGGGGSGSGDAHMLMVQTDECVLYELASVSHQADGWHAYSGAIWDLKINSTRPQGWTSADAAGLPIYAGLARYEEVAQGAINHALRFTAPATQQAYVAPASHCASHNMSTSLPPMGLHMRLSKNYDIGAAPPQSKIILTALKKYGMFLADNGSSWFITGAPDPGWDDNDLDYMKSVPGSAFEALPTGPLTTDCP